MNYVMNVTNGIMLGFYIFKGEKLKNDYIKFYKTNTCVAHNTKRTWMTCFMFKVFFFFFKWSILSGIFKTNRHLLIINEHGSHITLKSLKQTQAFGLNMITLPSHTSRALQPLDVACFKQLLKQHLRRKAMKPWPIEII